MRGGLVSVGRPCVGHGFVHLCVFVWVCWRAIGCTCMPIVYSICICYTSVCSEESIWPPLVRDITLWNTRLQTAEGWIDELTLSRHHFCFLDTERFLNFPQYGARCRHQNAKATLTCISRLPNVIMRDVIVWDQCYQGCDHAATINIRWCKCTAQMFSWGRIILRISASDALQNHMALLHFNTHRLKVWFALMWTLRLNLSVSLYVQHLINSFFLNKYVKQPF